MNPLPPAILLFLAALAYDVLTDYHSWKKGKAINHTKGAMERFLYVLPSLILFAASLPIYWILAFFISGVMEFFIWWLCFDGIYNKLRGFGWWFNGTWDAANEDSKLDRFVVKLKDWQEALLKILPTVIMIGLYIYLKYRE